MTAYRAIADRLKLPSRHDPKVDVLKLVYEWLSDEDNGKWLMVLDNVDDTETFFEPRQHGGDTMPTDDSLPLAKYLPQSCNGSFLITSRNKNAAVRLTGDYTNVREVCVMNAEEGLQLLHNKLQDMPVRESALDLLSALDYMPLAISQATAYINRRTRMTTTVYLDEFRASDRNKESLLNFESVDIRRDESASNSILITWQMSFDRIRQERPSAADLLSLMSFFHPQCIPEDIIQQHKKNHQTVCNDHVDDQSFDKDLDLLHAYSLITAVPNSSICGMHSLVQLFTRSWSKHVGLAQSHEAEFVHLIAQAYPAASFETRSECQQLLPHAERLLEIDPGDEVVVRAWAQALINVASFMLMQGSYKNGQNIMIKVLSVQEKSLDPDVISNFESLNLLGLLLHADGKYTEARKHIERALAGRINLLGEDHEVTLLSSVSLAAVLQDLGELKEAKSLLQQAFDHREKTLGSDHPSTLISASNLAIVLQDLGDLEEAARWNHYALRGRRAKLGQQHPDTLLSLNNLGGVQQAIGQFQESEDSYQQALDGRRLALGESHPLTLTSMSNLASVLREQEKYKESEILSFEVLRKRKEIDEKHPHTFTSMSNLSRVLEDQGKYDEAEDLSRQALRGRVETLGEDHLDTLISANNLAILLGTMKQYEEAATLFEKACIGLEAKLGPDHPWTKACRSTFSDMLREANPTVSRSDSFFARAKTRMKSRKSAQPVMTLQLLSSSVSLSRASSIATSSRRYGASAV